MKKILELLLCILHPVAVVLIWINLLGRDDLGLIGKLAWGIAVIVVLGVALVDFIVENTRSVEIHFFSVSGRLSVAAALLAAALAGAAVVLAVGVARTAQLRLSIRHHRQVHEAASAAATDSENAQSNPPAS